MSARRTKIALARKAAFRVIGSISEKGPDNVPTRLAVPAVSSGTIHHKRAKSRPLLGSGNPTAKFALSGYRRP
jgi:hypothetical protein